MIDHAQLLIRRITARHVARSAGLHTENRVDSRPRIALAVQMERPLGKRQVRPNLARSDFGYEERSKTTAAKNKKPKRADEEEEMAGGGASSEAPRPRGEKDARNLTVDFTKLDMATLKRYKRHYRLKTRQNVTKTELALAVAKHFASQTVDEADTISLFMYSARAGSLDLAAVARSRGAFN